MSRFGSVMSGIPTAATLVQVWTGSPCVITTPTRPGRSSKVRVGFWPVAKTKLSAVMPHAVYPSEDGSLGSMMNRLSGMTRWSVPFNPSSLVLYSNSGGSPYAVNTWLSCVRVMRFGPPALSDWAVNSSRISPLSSRLPMTVFEVTVTPGASPLRSMYWSTHAL